MKKNILSLFFALTGLTFGQAFHEGFEDVEALINSGGWARQNLSNTSGIEPDWYQGDPDIFISFSGPASAYAAVNYQSVVGADTISNWLFTPNVVDEYYVLV